MSDMQDPLERAERWKPVTGYEGIYEVSNHGRVRSVDRTITCSDGRVRRLKSKVRSAPLNADGYPCVGLYAQGEKKMRYVHSLVAESFIGARPEGMEVCHSDGNKTNNHVANLRFGTQSENTLDRVAHGTHHEAVKTHCPRDHELFAENLKPSNAKQGSRACLACARARSRVYYHPELKPQFKAIADSYYQSILANPKKEDKQ